MSARLKCQLCPVRMTAICGAIRHEALSDLGRIGHRIRIPQGRVIYGANQRSNTLGIIVSGVVKLVIVKPDGRTQIVGLQFASDFVGRPYLDATGVFAEAATELELCCFPGRVFEDQMRTHPDLERVLLKRTLDDLDSARDWMFLLGRKTAQEKVASLLYVIADRALQCCGDVKCERVTSMAMPLSRSEIAECLGLRVETVCRQLALLKARGVIATNRRRMFSVHRMSELKRYAESPVEQSDSEPVRA